MANRENRRVIRLRLGRPLKVVMKSIGSSVSYSLKTRNISHTGFFLDFDRPQRFPFTPASIMEVWLELEANKAVFFNGKMARVVLPEDKEADVTGPGIAIRIVQIDKENESILRQFVDDKISEKEGNSGSAA